MDLGSPVFDWIVRRHFVIQCMGDIVDRVLEDYEDQGVMSSDPVLSVLV
jgi:hypothetical protein